MASPGAHLEGSYELIPIQDKQGRNACQFAKRNAKVVLPRPGYLEHGMSFTLGSCST